MSQSNKIDAIHDGYVSDSGDQTQRNFRYQHAYGAILLIAGACKKKPYASVWCEHHEDLLAERIDKTYDAYQIKTRQPENGYWEITHEEVQKSLKRFVQLHAKFIGKINSFHFVSNTNFFDCGYDVKEDRLKKSPVKFLEAIKAAASKDNIAGPFDGVFKKLATDCDCTHKWVFRRS